jgi:hypothetical protein
MHIFPEICMPHAMQIRHTGGPEVLHSAYITVQHSGISPASVDDVTQNLRGQLGGRYRFKLLGAAATRRVQVQNPTNLHFWNMGYSPGFS